MATKQLLSGRRSGWSSVATLGLVVLGAACESPSTGPIVERFVPDTIALVTRLDAESMGEATPPDSPMAAVSLALFLHVRYGAEDLYYEPDEFEETLDEIVRHAQQVFGQCGISLSVEAASVIQLPERLRDVLGNRPGSWGGHPPPGTPDPALFNYRQDERLTEDTRELFGFAKRSTTPNSIAVVFVERITYNLGPETFPVVGLSFAPNLYHHVDDYPLRNAVLSREPKNIGDPASVVSHELGHMLLNSALHTSDPANLMNEAGSPAVLLTDDQCERAVEVADLLYGEEAVPDPGPPSS